MPAAGAVVEASPTEPYPGIIIKFDLGLMREICYWLLSGPHGGEIISMTMTNSHTRCVLSAIHALRDRFSEPIRIEELASAAHLSPSAFHRQFKSITSMTPLQYQKQLRLLKVPVPTPTSPI